MSAVGYHATPATNVGAIYRWGLIPRDTSSFHYPYEANANHGVEAVYVFTRRDAAEKWARVFGPLAEGERWVVLMIDLRDLPSEPDPVLTGVISSDGRDSAVRVLQRVPPERILERVL